MWTAEHSIETDLAPAQVWAALRALHHAPLSRATDKVLRALDAHCRRVIALSPFCVIATHGPKGADVSPRGDPPGVVRVLDDSTLPCP